METPSKPSLGPNQTSILSGTSTGHLGLTYPTSRISSAQRMPVRITQRYLSLVNSERKRCTDRNHYVNFNNFVRIKTKQCEPNFISFNKSNPNTVTGHVLAEQSPILDIGESVPSLMLSNTMSLAPKIDEIRHSVLQTNVDLASFTTVESFLQVSWATVVSPRPDYLTLYTIMSYRFGI